MEELKTENNGHKRSRVESGLDSASDSPDSKRVNTESDPSRCSNPPESDVMEEYVDLDSSEAKQIREDLLVILDEPDAVTDRSPEIQDLDYVIKSFEDEILHHRTVLDPTSSDSGDSQPDIGYLLEASDDELGLPPTFSPSDHHVNAESVVSPANAVEFENMNGFENELPNYDAFDFGMVAGATDGDIDHFYGDGDFVTVGGLFDYPDFSDFSWRPESLPAL